MTAAARLPHVPKCTVQPVDASTIARRATRTTSSPVNPASHAEPLAWRYALKAASSASARGRATRSYVGCISPIRKLGAARTASTIRSAIRPPASCSWNRWWKNERARALGRDAAGHAPSGAAVTRPA